MRVTEINTQLLKDKLAEKFGMSQWYWDVRAICLVEIKTNDGTPAGVSALVRPKPMPY